MFKRQSCRKIWEYPVSWVMEGVHSRGKGCNCPSVFSLTKLGQVADWRATFTFQRFLDCERYLNHCHAVGPILDLCACTQAVFFVFQRLRWKRADLAAALASGRTHAAEQSENICRTCSCLWLQVCTAVSWKMIQVHFCLLPLSQRQSDHISQIRLNRPCC